MEHRRSRDYAAASRHGRPGAGFRGKPEELRQEAFHRKFSPIPIGDNCNPLCPLFKCIRGALFLANKTYRGKLLKEAMCRLSGDKCVGYECQYSSCKINALLPDGKCAKALERKYRSVSEEELFREMREFEDYDIRGFNK